MIEAEDVQIVVVKQLVFFVLREKIYLCSRKNIPSPSRRSWNQRPTSAKRVTSPSPTSTQVPVTTSPGSTSGAAGWSTPAPQPPLTAGMRWTLGRGVAEGP